MRKLLIAAFAIATLLGTQLSTANAAGATPEQAIALVNQAAELVAHEGKEKALQVIDDPKGPLVKGELYVFATNLEGTTVGHPMIKALIGKNLMKVKDADGKLFVKEMVNVAQTKGEGWVDYKWVNPVTKKIEAKSSYIKKVGDIFVGCGIYKG